VAVKIQYPGVDESIDSDIDSLASIFRIAAQIPHSGDFKPVIDEVKEVLLQETDYLREGHAMDEFRGYFADMPGVAIPRYFAEYSTKRVLTTEYMRGVHPRVFGDGVASDELRHTLGLNFLHVFYRELFRLGVIQTDPNFANYLVDDVSGRLVLLDFGAVRRYDETWRRLYIEMIRGSFEGNTTRCIDTGVELGLIRADDSDVVKALHVELCDLFLEPFRTKGPYDFRVSDLPQRMKAMMPRVFKELGVRAPPREMIFLNRKMVGVYYFMSAIRARIDVRPLLEQYLEP
jgi:predicted unusual protein kinase regulating ubiquinone biosynthesis (AarF/ABC1/UbiB family)